MRKIYIFEVGLNFIELFIINSNKRNEINVTKDKNIDKR
jgi:hypothetical protein